MLELIPASGKDSAVFSSFHSKQPCVEVLYIDCTDFFTIGQHQYLSLTRRQLRKDNIEVIRTTVDLGSKTRIGEAID